MSDRLCVDTGPLIMHLRAGRGTTSPLAQLGQDPEIVISAISVAELWQGARPMEGAATQALVDLCTVVPVDEATARSAGGLVASCRARRLVLGLPDALVAATALVLHAPLWTTNAKDFAAVEGLAVLPL